VEYTNGGKTGLNKYETRVSRRITRKVRKFRMGFGKVRGGTGRDKHMIREHEGNGTT